MKKLNLIYIFIFLASIFLTSCQSIKDGLSGRKSENSDEFLVQKKNPLVVPPDFMKLPKPEEEDLESEDSILEDQTDIQKILKINKGSQKTSSKNFKKTEEFVLQNINK